MNMKCIFVLVIFFLRGEALRSRIMGAGTGGVAYICHVKKFAFNVQNCWRTRAIKVHGNK